MAVSMALSIVGHAEVAVASPVLGILSFEAVDGFEEF